jgi:hypothetical protein
MKDEIDSPQLHLVSGKATLGRQHGRLVCLCQPHIQTKSKRESPNQGSNLGPYPGKKIHVLLMKARCEGYVITTTLSGLATDRYRPIGCKRSRKSRIYT